MRIRVLFAFLVSCLWVACSPRPPAQPTTTPQPARSKLRIESFLAYDKTGARADTVRVQPGDTINTEIVVSGLKNNGAGKVAGTVTLTLSGGDIEKIQLQSPKKDFEEVFSDDGRLSLNTSSTVGPTDPPGVYKLTALVVDQSADLEVEKPITVIIEQSAGSPSSNANSAEPASSTPATPAEDQGEASAGTMKVTSLEFAASETGPGMDPAVMTFGSKAFIRYELTGLQRDPNDGHSAMTINVKVTKPDGTIEGPARMGSDKYPAEMDVVKGMLTMEASPEDPPGLYHMEMAFLDEISQRQIVAQFVYTLKAQAP